jgi:2-polyprenyl-6-methoxyphenol hydroxylase-like FAD-dependent oxidoreductase
MTDGWRLFGLKVHARGVALAADLEMHFVPSGYVGLCRLAGGEVNICGLFRSKSVVPDLAQRWRDWLGGPAASVLRSRLAEARFDENSFCSVAGLCLRPQRATQRNECCVGDALTMIPPVTGNGMSMAFESAELAIEPLAEFSYGQLTWDGARHEIATRCDKRFTPRLRWAAWVQRALFQPAARAALMFLAARSEWFSRGIFGRTR